MNAPTLRLARQLDPENPWPGLAAFEEEAQDYFHGREGEAEELVRRVIDAQVIALFGKSGLGKTSLLKAGLFPRLRAKHFLPVYVRLDFGPSAPPFVDQLRDAFFATLAEQDIEFPAMRDGESLWAYLHRADLEMWSAQNFLLTPLLVIDQFEEVFTLGERMSESVQRFEHDLGDLAENRIPAALTGQLEADADAAEKLDLRTMRYKLLLSLREDFLPELEGWRRALPSLGRVRVRLLPMRPDQALAAVSRSAPQLMDEHIARRIVAFVTAAQASTGAPTAAGSAAAEDGEASAGEVEPALLSLFCRGLNERRKRAGKTKFDDQLLNGVGQSIISEYYVSCVADLPESASRFIENELITAKGFRNSYAKEDAVPSFLTEEQLSGLINRRLLRLQDRYGAACIELTHDLLTGAVREHRDRRETADAARAEREREEAERREIEERARAERERFEAKARTQRRRTLGLTAFSVVCLVLTLWAFYEWTRAVDAERIALERLHTTNAARLASRSELFARPAFGLGVYVSPLLAVAGYRVSPTVETTRSLLDAQARLGRVREIADTGRPIRAIALSPDGTQIVTGSADGALLVRNAMTLELIGKPLQAHTKPVLRLAFAPDGKMFVSADEGGTLMVWDAATRRPLTGPVSTGGGAVHGLAFSPDGRVFVSGSEDGSLTEWDAATTPPRGTTWRGHQDKIYDIAFSPDGRTFVSASRDKTLLIWATATREPLGTLLPKAANDTDSTYTIAFSPDGNMIVTGGTDDALTFWNATTREPLDEPAREHKDDVNRIAFSPDGKRIVSASADGTLVVWDAATRRPVGERLRGDRSEVTAVAFNPDGSIISGSANGTLIVWDPSARHPIAEPRSEHNSEVSSIAFSPDGTKFVSAAHDSTLIVWDTATRKRLGKLRGHEDKVLGVAFSPDGKTIVSGGADKTLRFWDVATFRGIGESSPKLAGTVWGVAASFDGKTIASAGADGVQLWDVVTREAIGKPMKHEGESVALSVAFSPDSKRIVSGGGDGTVIVWNVATNERIAKPLREHRAGVYSVAFGPNGKIVSGSIDGTLIVWDAATLKAIGEPLRGHEGAVLSVAFSPDGSKIVSGGTDLSLIVWDADTRQALGEPLRGHERHVSSVAVGAKVIVSGSKDGTLIVWDLDPESWIGNLCAKLRRNLTQSEWNTYVGDEVPYEEKLKQCADRPVLQN